MKKLKYIGPLPLPRKVSIRSVVHEIDASGNVSGDPDPTKAESMVRVSPESWKFVECEAPAKKETAPAKKASVKEGQPKKPAPKKASQKPSKKK